MGLHYCTGVFVPAVAILLCASMHSQAQNECVVTKRSNSGAQQGAWKESKRVQVITYAHVTRVRGRTHTQCARHDINWT
jgi:hypothetical protein